MNTKNKFQILISVPWGEGRRKIQPKFVDYPNFGDMSSGQMRQTYAPLRFKLDPNKGLHVLNDGYCNILDTEQLHITHFSPEATLIGRTHVPKLKISVKERYIIDFVVDDALNCYLIEKYMPEHSQAYFNRLLKVDEDGGVMWEMRGILTQEICDFNELKGAFGQLLIDGHSRLFLTSTSQMNAIAQVSPNGGDFLNLYVLEKDSNNAFINGQGSIQRVVYFESQNRRGLSILNPSSREEKYTVCGIELFGLLLFPFGSDNQLNCYVYKIPNVYEVPALVKISWAGEVVHQENLKDLLVRSNDNTIFTSYTHNTTLEISGYYQDGMTQRWSIQMPDQDFPGEASQPKLVKVDEQTRFYILVGEEPGNAGTLLIFSEDGTLDNEISPSPDLLRLESTLQPYDYWQVDEAGNVYFPITEPTGFKVVRMHFSK